MEAMREFVETASLDELERAVSLLSQQLNFPPLTNKLSKILASKQKELSRFSYSAD